MKHVFLNKIFPALEWHSRKSGEPMAF